jgi:hypothetical protein
MQSFPSSLDNPAPTLDPAHGWSRGTAPAQVAQLHTWPLMRPFMPGPRARPAQPTLAAQSVCVAGPATDVDRKSRVSLTAMQWQSKRMPVGLHFFQQEVRLHAKQTGQACLSSEGDALAVSMLFAAAAAFQWLECLPASSACACSTRCWRCAAGRRRGRSAAAASPSSCLTHAGLKGKEITKRVL